MPKPQTSVFEGDFYSNDYSDDDFEWKPTSSSSDDSSSQLGEEGDEDEGDDEDFNVDDDDAEILINGYGNPSWEPPPNSEDVEVPPELMDVDDDSSEHNPQAQAQNNRLQRERVVHKFTAGNAGAPIQDLSAVHLGSQQTYQVSLGGEHDDMNPYAPFGSKLEWELGKWAKLRGPGETAFTELLKIEDVSVWTFKPHKLIRTLLYYQQISTRLGLAYKNARELNKLFDGLPSTRPRFSRGEAIVAGQGFDFYFRDIIECVGALFGDPEFAPHLVFAPERHYLDEDHTVRVYDEMHTGKWWWSTQVC